MRRVVTPDPSVFEFQGGAQRARLIPRATFMDPDATPGEAKRGLDEKWARRMLGCAERYCPTVQALRNGVNVTTDFAIANS
jgi:hypothetical protein